MKYLEQNFKEDNLEYAYATSVGFVRENNEDNAAIISVPDAPIGSGVLAVVADGMGGHAAGEIASSLCVNSIISYIQQNASEINSYDKLKCLLENAFREAHKAIRESATGEKSGMGTTVTAAFYTEDKVILAHAGDSRAYVISPGKIRQVTEDDSLVSGGHILTNALTQSPNLLIHLYEEKLADGEHLLLCTDGLHGVISPDTIWSIVCHTNCSRRAAEHLVNAANHAGGPDNVTVICLRKGIPQWQSPKTVPIVIDYVPSVRRKKPKQIIAICGTALAVIIILMLNHWAANRDKADIDKNIPAAPPTAKTEIIETKPIKKHPVVKVKQEAAVRSIKKKPVAELPRKKPADQSIVRKNNTEESKTADSNSDSSQTTKQQSENEELQPSPKAVIKSVFFNSNKQDSNQNKCTKPWETDEDINADHK